MGKIETLTVGLPIEVVEAIKKAVANGEYPSESSVLVDAMRVWHDVRDTFGITDERLGALWDAGIASGPGHFPSIDDLLAEADKRAQQVG